jgi:hypothetical protein
MERLETLVAVVDTLAREIQGLAESWRGEQGRREGERYEQDTLRHAFAIFGGGRGVAERPEDLDRLRGVLAPVAAALTEPDDPFLADLLWQKGGRIAVVEVSRQVDRSDVERAARRAATLRAAGLDALPVVIGRDWTSDQAEAAARERFVEWRVAEEASQGYLDFRREPAA